MSLIIFSIIKYHITLFTLKDFQASATPKTPYQFQTTAVSASATKPTNLQEIKPNGLDMASRDKEDLLVFQQPKTVKQKLSAVSIWIAKTKIVKEIYGYLKTTLKK